ncbi:FGGY family carbohydrate kinase [Saprospiraceae bacterium]|nr:FGGY family carbohydrate kinase [Saprospiraceae bacterium]
MYLLGYDIGSSSIKAALVDADTRKTICVVQYPELEMEIVSRRKTWAEQQPEMWWENLCICTKKLLERSSVKNYQIVSVGISYQMHGLVAIDHQQNVLRPSIIWCDSRAVSIGKGAFSGIGMNYCLSNFLNSPGNFTASKLKWIKDNEPDLYEKIDKILLPGEYIAMKLTKVVATSISGLTEGVFWNFKEKRIATEVLDYYELDKSVLPEIKGTFEKIGKITKQAAKQTGLYPGIPITYRAGDQPNNALSLNVLHKGEVAATSGTSGVVYGVVDHLLSDLQSRINSFAHVNYESNYKNLGILLCINGAGIQYSWMKQQVALANRTYQDMERMMKSIPVGSEGVCVLPFGNGAERMFNNKNIDSHVHNLQFNRHTRAHLYRASVEGVAFSFVHGLNLLKEMGLKVDKIRVGNDNMFQSDVFSNTIATLMGNQIELVNTTGAVGAALASGVAIENFSSIEEAMSAVRAEKVFEPSLNYAKCNQAFTYWQDFLDRRLHMLEQSSDTNSSSSAELIALKKELERKDAVIESQSLILSSKNELIEKVTEVLDDTSVSIDSKFVNLRLEKMQRMLNKAKLAGQNSEVLENHFDILNKEFIKMVTTRFPALSFDELKLTYFLKMKLSTKEIAERLNLSLRGTETKRFRLRKKFALKKSQNLSKFIEALDC